MIPRPAFAARRVTRPSSPRPIHDSVTWTRELSPRERYRVLYIGSDGEPSTREIELLRIGTFSGSTYLGVMHAGKFKTLRADRIFGVEQLSSGHEPSLRAYPSYASPLPPFPVANAVFRVPTVAGNRTWKVDLNAWSCTCPEKRQRTAAGYRPGELGFVCPHIARAILDNLPTDADTWTPELREFLADPRRVHLDNLT